MSKSETTRRMNRPQCGLCGKTRKLTRTECCGNWICDDEHKYVIFSYAHNSCHRNHRRFTLCAYHHNEGHDGDWKDCVECRRSFKTEMYVWYGTNEYNFQKLPNPPSFKPTRCAHCGVIIHLGTDGYSQLGNRYLCEDCSDEELEKKSRRIAARHSAAPRPRPKPLPIRKR